MTPDVILPAADTPTQSVPPSPTGHPEPDESASVRDSRHTRTDWVDDVRVLVAMPAYNEGGTVGAVVEAVQPYADGVLVVDDGSQDDTALEAIRAGALVVSHPVNRGYGGALKTIFREAATRGAAHLVIIDADGQHNPADIPRLVAEQVETGANVVIGSRFVAGAATDAPLYRRCGLWVINSLTNLSLGAYRANERLSDAQSGFRAYDAAVTGSLAADDRIGDCMAASLDVLYHVYRNGYTVSEVGTNITYAVDHANSQNPVTQGFDLVSAIFATTVRDRPLFALGVPGIAVALVGLFVTFFVLVPVAPLEFVGTFSLVTLCGFGLCGLGVHRHRTLRRAQARPSGSTSAHALSED